MSARQSLMDELEEAVRHGSREQRMDTLRRVTDLFLISPQQFDNEQIALFDDVLSHMIARVETKARAELAKRLAPVDQAPNEIIRRLAHDDEIAVAGPVLSQSSRLTTADLVGIAEQKGQAHLLAIAGRSVVEQQVTDVLVDRGDRSVVHRLAANTGASFSETGYSRLVRRAETDEHLIEKIGRRLDIPLQLFRELLLKASEAVRNRLIAAAGPDRQELVRRVVAEIADEVAHEAPATRNVEDAQRLVLMMKETGRLNEGEVLTFAQRGKFDEVVAGVAALCGVSFDLIDRLVRSGRADAALVPCKAINFNWPTVRAILEARKAQGCAEHDIESAASEYAKLSAATAARVLRFWQVRQTTTQIQTADPAAQQTAAE
jgi:uncharacterized protein (DUF2336 family)